MRQAKLCVSTAFFGEQTTRVLGELVCRPHRRWLFLCLFALCCSVLGKKNEEAKASESSCFSLSLPGGVLVEKVLSRELPRVREVVHLRHSQEGRGII